MHTESNWLPSRENWTANEVQLPSDEEICYIDVSKEGDLMRARVYQ